MISLCLGSTSAISQSLTNRSICRRCLSDAIDALTRESRQGEKCLVFFSKMEENEPCELFIDCLGAQITGLDVRAGPSFVLE